MALITNTLFSLADGRLFADWHSCVWSKCISGHQSAHYWGHSCLWSHTHPYFVARFGWRSETSSSDAVFRILLCISTAKDSYHTIGKAIFSLTKKKQIDNYLLLQYMIILFLLFLIQFSIASSCLAVNSDQQKQFAEEGWNRVSDELKSRVQETFVCCGFNATDAMDNHPSCDSIMVRRYFDILLLLSDMNIQ